MSKELIRPDQYGKAKIVKSDFAQLSESQLSELQELYEGAAAKLRQG